MKPAKERRIRRLDLHTTQGHAGSLHRESQFVMRYDQAALDDPRLAISLTMPPRPEGYRGNVIPPVLAMNLPEGFLLDRVSALYRKIMDLDDMNLLALTSTPTAGRVWACIPEEEEVAPGAAPPPTALRDLLSARGTEALFDELVERYALHSPISGVQPKVLVPGALVERAEVHTPDLIVKTSGIEFPGLAENEFLCMGIAKHAGIEVPEFWLSESRSLFVIRRFDLRPEGGYLGFEDLASLMGRQPRDKYEGAFSEAARAVGDFCALRHRADSLEAFFRRLVLCCLLRNGDAHLKNWGVLYGDPVSADDDARLAPAYDIVCTVAWIANDTLALGLGGTKAWPDRRALVKFGKEHCELPDSAACVDDVLEKAMAFRPAEVTPMWKTIRAVIMGATASLR